MGKTYRKNHKIPISYSWSSPHSRDFAKRNKRKHQHSLRNKNRNKDEMTIDYYQDSPYTLKSSWSNYLGDTQIIPTINYIYDYDEEIKTEYHDEIEKLKTEYRKQCHKIPDVTYLNRTDRIKNLNEYYKNINWKEFSVFDEINFRHQYNKIDLCELDIFDSVKNKYLYYKKINWNDNQLDHKDFVEYIMNNSLRENQKKSMKIRKKQIERRGKEGQFKGHR